MASLMLVALVPVTSVAAQTGPGTEVPFESRKLAGGPVRVRATGAPSDVRWILPGQRELDPKVFGTPDMPLGFEDDVGVPLDARLTNEARTEYTTTAGPTPFSDNFADISGSFEMEATDAQLMDGSSTEDELSFTANFTTRNDNYELGFNEDVYHDRFHFHLMMPNVEVTPDGPQESPVPTGFELPNGQEQPFFHIMYEDVSIEPAMVAPPAEPAEAPEAALPETGAATTPWLVVALVGGGTVLLLGGFLIAYRRRMEAVRMAE